MRWMRWLLCIVVAGCNQFYGLEETETVPPAPDLDHDGVADDLDNCVRVANSDQRDVDGDRIGDACDLCPTVASTNHDEDLDTRGDECDLCPTRPNFDLDFDGDGIGDDCDNDFASQNAVVLFDPFVVLGDAWQPIGAPWFSNGDAAESMEVDSRLMHADARVNGTKKFWIEIGFGSREKWDGGDRFGVELVDPGTQQVHASCLTFCPTSVCGVSRFPPTTDTAMPAPIVLATAPATTLHFNQTDTLLACVIDGAVDSDAKIALGELQLVVVGSPRIHVRYVFVWQ